jgi:hypothetical protein
MIGRRNWYTRSLLMKFSVAPESSNVSISALLDAVYMYALMVIDFLSDKYMRSSVPLLIQAAQIRVFKNRSARFPPWEVRSFGVAFLCLWERVRGLRHVALPLSHWWASGTVLLGIPSQVWLGTGPDLGPIRRLLWFVWGHGNLERSVLPSYSYSKGPLGVIVAGRSVPC